VEFEGELRWVGKHMGGQKVIQEFERDVEQYMDVERDMSNFPGRMAFYREAGLRLVLERRAEDVERGDDVKWFSLLYPLKPGREEEVSELFRNSPRPDHEVKDANGNELGKLLTTLVFVGNGHAIRTVEVEGDIRTVAAHIGSQPAVAALENDLEQHLREFRDVRSPEGAQTYFATAGMRNVLVRKFEPGLAEAAKSG
jgi:hypothetical protein